MLSSPARAQARFDAAAFRADFPALESFSHLASCSQGAISGQLETSLGRLTAGLHHAAAPWGEWMQEWERLRRRFAAFIHADPDEIAILPSASAGAYQVASSFDWSTGRPGVLTSDLEFPSVGHVLRAQGAHGADVRSVGDRHAALDAQTWTSRLDETVRLVSIPLVSYHDGAMAPLAEVTTAAHAVGAQVLVDAYQGMGVVPIDVRELDCDYLVAGTLKYMLGLAGVAFLYVRGGLTSERSPEMTGWFGRTNPFAFDPALVDYPSSASRFEGGTPSVPSVYAAHAGLDLLEGVDQQAGWAHVRELRDGFIQALRAKGFEVSASDDEARRGPQVSIVVDDPDELALQLHERGVMTAPRGRLLRMSLHYYTVEADLQRALDALVEITGAQR
ncbi:aminotransferase class V-fold PLP-dependent enzyme [Kineococcus sp. SYSU DK003]|uniref:aminotransferase class V-fold PLP-dependent enzyme n=1 Tax=Kineococcus sp. SYSU DK003 TaxID=3383124 RepID=UPI003D7D6366